MLRVAPVLAAVGIVGSILFGPQGIRCRDLLRAMHLSFGLRAGLWLGWLIVTIPAAFAIVHSPGTHSLRALRIPTRPLTITLLLLMALVHVPGILFYGRVGLPHYAGTAILIHASGMAALRRPRYAVLTIGGLVTALFELPPVLALAAPFAILSAWRTGSERPASALHIARRTQPVLALTIMYALRLARTARPRVMTAALFTAIGSAGMLTVRAEESPFTRAFAIMALPLAFAAAVLATPLIECERGIRWLIASVRVPRVAVVAFFVALITPTSALAATASLVTPCHVGPALAGWGAVIALAVGGWARRGRAREPVFYVLGVMAIGALALGGALAW